MSNAIDRMQGTELESGSRQDSQTWTWAKYERIVLGVCGVLGLLVVWEICGRTGLVRPILISYPTLVLDEGLSMIVDGSVWPHLRATFQIWFAGFAIASLVGILIGLLAGTFRPLQALANPWLNVMDSLPDLALIPIFILWFGIGAEFKIFLVFFSCLFFVAVNTMKGTEIIARQYDEVARSLGPSRLLHFRSILLPGSFPFIITGLRQGAARGLVGVIVAEFVSAQAGIGFMISVAGATLNTERVMFGIFILAIAGIGVGELLGRIEKRYQAWVPDG